MRVCNNVSANLGPFSGTIDIDLFELFPFAETKENDISGRG